MTKTSSPWRRRILSLLCTLLLLGCGLPGSAHGEGLSVNTSASSAYFQTFSSKGQWVDIGTPLHTIVETGQIAYCLQTDFSSPNGSGYYSIEGSDYYDQTTLTGLQAILENGYPLADGGYGAEQARYATANAIRFWLAERGAEGVPAWMDLSQFSQFFRAKTGYEGLYGWCMSLLSLARSQSVSGGSIALSPSTLSLSQQGAVFTGAVSVALKGCTEYKIDEYTLPFGLELEGYTGKTGDILTITASESLSGQTLELWLEGNSRGGAASLLFFAPYNAGEQRVLVYDVNAYGSAASAKLSVSVPERRSTGSLKLYKQDPETAAPLPGAHYALCKANGGQIRSGTTDENGLLVFEDLELGSYFYQELSAPEGYILDSSQYPFTLSYNGQILEVTRNNYPSTASISLRKQDAYGNALPGAVFELELSTDGGVHWQSAAQAETDEKGLAAFSNLSPGSGVYRLSEIKAPPGQKWKETTRRS